MGWTSYKYAMENMGTPSNQGNRQIEDAYIRYSIHLRDRLADDGDWFRTPAWSHYPPSDRFTTHARSFPAILLTWAHLTMVRINGQWQHVASDADSIYHQLQRTFPYYDPFSTTSFSDRLTGTDTAYLAYSLAQRERDGYSKSRGVINAHAHALHFAWLMREASELFGDTARAAKWEEVVGTHHAGSRELFTALYPGQLNGITYLGLINYSLHQPGEIHNTAYSAITFEATPAGYLLAGTYEPQWIDVVERFCRRDWDPMDEKIASSPHSDAPVRLWRAFPPTLAFAASVDRPMRRFDDAAWADWETSSQIKVLAGDFNDDGKTDVMKFDVLADGSEGNGGLWVGLSTGSSFGTCKWADWVTSSQTKVLAGDFNGDGKTDVMKFDVLADGSEGNGGLWVGLSTGSSFATSKWADWVTSSQIKVLAGDFNDDGKTDVMKFDVLADGSEGNGGLWVGLSTGSSFGTSKWADWVTSSQTKVLAGDFNGDGKTDVMKFDVLADGSEGNGGLWVGLSTGSSFATSKWADWVTSSQTKVLAGDFNGDGKTDVMKFDVLADGSEGNGGLWVGLSTGSSFATSKWADWVTSSQTKVLAGDFDDDGRTDVMKFDVLPNGELSRSGLWVGLSDGGKFATDQWAFWDTNATMEMLAGNFDGVGATDVMKFDIFSTEGSFGLWVGLSQPVPAPVNTAPGRSVSVFGLREALGGASEPTTHDPDRYIAIEGGRSWIRTDVRFATCWAPGYWEEKQVEEVPWSRRFTVTALPHPGRRRGHYAAHIVRQGSGDRIELACDFDASFVSIHLPAGASGFRVERREYTGGAFGSPVLVHEGLLPAGPATLEIGPAQTKSLIIVSLYGRPL